MGQARLRKARPRPGTWCCAPMGAMARRVEGSGDFIREHERKAARVRDHGRVPSWVEVGP